MLKQTIYIFAFLFTGLNALTRLERGPNSDFPTRTSLKHGCHPDPCCGCDTRRDRARIRVLTERFFTLISEPYTAENALELTTANANATVIGEFCDNKTCCVRVDTMSDFVAQIGPVSITYWIEKIEKTYSKEYIAYVTALFSYSQSSPPFELNTRLAFKWIPTIGCNHKIDDVQALSFACQLPVTTTCSSCITPTLKL